MSGTSLPSHWRFAAGQAYAGLKELVHSFDFVRLADGHTYAGITPDYLIEVIDGFLGENGSVVFGGDRQNLLQLRQLLIERIKPVYQQGLAAGRQHWHGGVRVYGSLETEDLHRLALLSGPADETLKGWFAEGFCFAYSYAEMDSLRGQVGD